MELNYTRVGGYELPRLRPPENIKAGKFGQKHMHYLRQYHSGIYNGLLISGKLKERVETVDREARQMMERLVAGMAKAQGVTEEMKARDQMAWVGAMNNIRSAAEETVLRELVYK